MFNKSTGRPQEISNFADTGDWTSYCHERGIGINTSFCLSVSKIMEKYKLSFPAACDFLEEKGYLIWAGNVPIYNLAGSKLWMDEKQKTVKPVVQAKTSDYTSDSEIKCIFVALVIKNKPIEEKYHGGLKAFVNKHNSLYNDNITTIMAMSGGDIAIDAVELLKCGLVVKQDFVVFDASNEFIPLPDYSEINLGVDWLKAYWHDGHTIVQYVHR